MRPALSSSHGHGYDEKVGKQALPSTNIDPERRGNETTYVGANTGYFRLKQVPDGHDRLRRPETEHDGRVRLQALIQQSENAIHRTVGRRTDHAIYPIVFLDCIVLKVRENNRIINKSLYLALGIDMQGHKELLGMWLAQNEGAKFWLSVLSELKNRRLQDILIACVDGLKGFPDAIVAEYP